MSTSSAGLDSDETQYVQSFYDTTYRAQMIRCLVEALRFFEGLTDDVESNFEKHNDLLTNYKQMELQLISNCVHIFSELVLTSSKFMQQV